MASITRFEDIEAWQMARELCRSVHAVTSVGEFNKSYALRDQLDRSSGSAMDNIAEGFDGGSNPEFIRFLGYAQRSCSEVKSQLYRAADRALITPEVFAAVYDQADKTHAKIGGFIKYLKSTRA
jgi:four helix bundle protein